MLELSKTRNSSYMTFYSVIENKQSGAALSQDEIDYFVAGYVEEKIPDYQVSALLMAVFFQGMNFEETYNLTQAMLKSGDRLNFGRLPGKRVGKHSTGGVGDKVSLLLAPTIASLGGQVPIISGRGLGHTGGTLDKLESIRGFNVALSPDEIRRQTVEIGAVFAGQSERIVPADMKIYALRDVTATVKSIPLIAASIISKKAAEGIDTLVLDVKTGDGAIFSQRDKSLELAKTMVKLGKAFGIETVALITAMDQPLGRTVGNWLEVDEVVDILHTGQGAPDLMKLNEALGAVMLKLSGLCESINDGIKQIRSAVSDGRALDKFKEIVKAQGGEPSFCERKSFFSPVHMDIFAGFSAPKSGYIRNIPARRVGELAVKLGAGRTKMDDSIDYHAGFVFHRKRGERVEKGDIVVEAFANSRDRLDMVAAELADIISYSDEPPPHSPMIEKVVTPAGEFSWEEYGG